MKKDLVIGLGEIGNPILKLLSKKSLVVGLDKNKKLMNNEIYLKHERIPVETLHVCIPFTTIFENQIHALVRQHDPSAVVIHSTISPGTTQRLQKKLDLPVIYSATRGVHKRMLSDLKRYTKFYAIEADAPKNGWATKNFEKTMRKAGVKTRKMSSPLTLELAKIIVDTSYYGWLITYSQLSNMIAIKNKVNYDEMWEFADEIHKFLGNRPKMFPGFIGGHCVLPNLDLINDDTLNLIKEINLDYAKILKKRRAKNKKY